MLPWTRNNSITETIKVNLLRVSYSIFFVLLECIYVNPYSIFLTITLSFHSFLGTLSASESVVWVNTTSYLRAGDVRLAPFEPRTRNFPLTQVPFCVGILPGQWHFQRCECFENGEKVTLRLCILDFDIPDPSVTDSSIEYFWQSMLKLLEDDCLKIGRILLNVVRSASRITGINRYIVTIRASACGGFILESLFLSFLSISLSRKRFEQ